ncbi:MAG: hypothetical protein KC422_22575 [Trueperaceae bacterium]|nr:hypothetical protein [Trueperaceae bacterium]
MEATVIYNQNAGGADKLSVDEAMTLLGKQGYDPVYKATGDEEDLDEVLENTQGLVVAVGGDGTQRAVACRLIGKDAAMTIIPLGTANNIARTLGIEGSPEAIIRGLGNPIKLAFDVGQMESPFGKDYFLEAAGCGLFADLLYDYDPDQGKSVLRALNTLKDVAIGYEPKYWQVSLDGKPLSNEYIGLEILNTKATGPRLKLAPKADPTDGLLDVVCVKEPELLKLFDYMGKLFSDAFDEMDNVQVVQGKKLELHWNGSPFHIDAQLHPDPQQANTQDCHGQPISIELLPGALKLYKPGKVAD